LKIFNQDFKSNIFSKKYGCPYQLMLLNETFCEKFIACREKPSNVIIYILIYCTNIEPEVVGTTGISSGAEPSTQGMCNCGALALIIIVLKKEKINIEMKNTK
jgi:hypothetical protein